MMRYFTTVANVQDEISRVFHTTGTRASVPQALLNIYNSGKYLEQFPPLAVDKVWDTMDDEEFLQHVKQLPIGLDLIIQNETENKSNKGNPVGEDLMFSLGNDLIVFKAFNYINIDMHKHNFFEMGYILRGHCLLTVEQETLDLQPGQFYIIGPNARHCIQMDDDESVLICIDIRKSTFENAFFNLMAGEDLLSYFFQSILARPDYPNYIIFTTKNEDNLHRLLKTLMMESYLGDNYHNLCGISLVNLLMCYMLRHYSDTIQFYSYDFLSTRAPLIMRYIQTHYQTVTLHELAQVFHYNEAYLSTLISKNAGMNFSTLLNKLKTGRAKSYLETSNLSVQEISEAVGYSSADHFSRTFKQYYNCSPQKYRMNFRREKE